MRADLYKDFKGKTCPIDPPTRVRCTKCGANLHPDPARNLGRHSWCDTCRWLLREPEPPFPRYSGVCPPTSMLTALGLVPTFIERSASERIPNDSRVEFWPELQPKPLLTAPPTLDSLLRRAA